MYWHTEGQSLTDGHRQFHATQSLFSFNLAQSHFNGALSYIHTATYRLLMQHSCISVQHSRSSMQHSRICMQHSRISMQHSRISMQHSHISVQHSRISVQHSRISMQQRWPLSATVRFRVSTIVPAIHHHRLGAPGQADAFRPTARATHVVVIMARGRGSRSLSICVASSSPPGCGYSTRVRFHCTIEVSKPFAVQLKIRSLVTPGELKKESEVTS